MLPSLFPKELPVFTSLQAQEITFNQSISKESAAFPLLLFFSLAWLFGFRTRAFPQRTNPSMLCFLFFVADISNLLLDFRAALC